jgi:hypothetical protein
VQESGKLARVEEEEKERRKRDEKTLEEVDKRIRKRLNHFSVLHRR